MIEKVTIKAIDPDRVEKDDSFPRAYAFYILLSATPGPIWTELFVSRYESSFNSLKREMTIQGDEIRMVTAPGEEARHVEFIRGLIEQTNRAVDEYNRAAVEQGVKNRTLAGQEAAEAERIKETLRKLPIG